MPENTTTFTQKQQQEIDKQVQKQVKKRLSRNILDKTARVSSEFKKYTASALITALGLLIALAWKDLIFKLIQNFTKTDLLLKYPFLAELYTVIIITIIGVMGLMIVTKWAQKPEIKKEEKK